MATVGTAVAPAIGCPAAGSVVANQDFKLVVGRKTRIVHLNANGDCDVDWRTGKVFLHHARLRVRVDGQPALIDAKQDKRHSDIARVTITGHDAVIVGSWAGVPFTVTLHDGGARNRDDTVRVQYGSFDIATLATRHGEVHISSH